MDKALSTEEQTKRDVWKKASGQDWVEPNTDVAQDCFELGWKACRVHFSDRLVFSEE